MSNGYELVCHETRQRLWIGQGWGEMTNFYSGDPEVMEHLRQFLVAHMGRPMYLICDASITDDELSYARWMEPEEEE